MKKEDQVMLSFKVDQATVDALDSIAARLAVANFSDRPNRTAALRYAVNLATEEGAGKKNKPKNNR
jgi:hypothetical protein